MSAVKKTAEYLRRRKADGKPISMLTCYDYPTATWEDEAGVDVVLVGDSVGTNVLGYASEKDVTMADMVHHSRAVARGVSDAYVLVDMPFASYDSPAEALRNARDLVAAGADGVKLEGFLPDTIRHLVGGGVEVCAHLGLTPQTADKKSLQARTADAAVKLVADAIELERAGAAMIVLELVPEEVAEQASARLAIPTIGIGAGRCTDGQVLISLDMLGASPFDLRHNRKYENLRERGIEAIRKYVAEVATGAFPGEEHARHLAGDELEAFRAAIATAHPEDT